MYNETNFHGLINVGESLFTTHQFKTTLNLISNHLTTVTGAERCSIFIYNKIDDELLTIMSTGIEKIQVSTEKGIVGYVFRTQDSIIENNVVSNPYFLGDIDKESGYSTRNIAACPIFNSEKKIIGVLELLNKLDGFDESELLYLNTFSNYISSVLELAPFYLNIEKRFR